MQVRFRAENGVALVSVLLALALMTAVGAAVLAVGSVDFQTSTNHRSATRALMHADAGLTHALALLRGPLSREQYTDLLLGDDGMPDTDDDGILAGFGLSATDALPDTGVRFSGGRYFVTLVNDPTDPSGDPFTDTNWRMLATCRAVTDDGGEAEVRGVLAAPNFPAIAANGNLSVPGNPDVMGPCAGVHSNRITTTGGIPTVDGPVTAVDTVMVENVIYDADGNIVTPRSGEAPIEMPDYDPLEYCGDADYILDDGYVITVSTGDSVFTGGGAGGKEALGWQWVSSDNTYSLSGGKAVPGTVCAMGNVYVGGNTGAEGAPLPISILSTGSVEVAGNPNITASHPEGFLILADGDIKVSGTASGSTPNFEGLLYAGSQCMVDGTPAVDGFILCKDEPDPAGATNLTDENIIKGDPILTYDCTGKRRLALISSWWEARTN